EGRGNEEGYGSQRGGEGGDMRARLLGSAPQAHCRAHRSFEKSVRRTLRSLPQHKLLLLARPVRLADKLSWRDHPVQLFPPGAPPDGWWGMEERGVNPPLPFTLTHSLLHSNSRVVCSKAPAAAGTAVEEMRSCNQLSLTPVDERLAHHSSLKSSVRGLRALRREAKRYWTTLDLSIPHTRPTGPPEGGKGEKASHLSQQWSQALTISSLKKLGLHHHEATRDEPVPLRCISR
ncbi:MAG: hypothetical protein SGPRY_007554, partial [Prymnesium sp.]